MYTIPTNCTETSEKAARIQRKYIYSKVSAQERKYAGNINNKCLFCRVLVYVVPVVFVSIALNIPKWFETTIEYEPINPVEK